VNDEPVAVVVGRDAAKVGAVVADLQARGVRAGAFVGDPERDRDALVEMITELYGERADPTSEAHPSVDTPRIVGGHDGGPW
jgi:hypothetical protein